MNTVGGFMSRKTRKWIIILYVSQETTGQLGTDRVPLDAVPRPHVMQLRDTFFNLNSNITHPAFAHSM